MGTPVLGADEFFHYLTNIGHRNTLRGHLLSHCFHLLKQQFLSSWFPRAWTPPGIRDTGEWHVACPHRADSQGEETNSKPEVHFSVLAATGA